MNSPALLDELDEKLRLKFGLSPNDADLVRAQLQSIAVLVKATVILAVIKDDPGDNRVLACAQQGKRTTSLAVTGIFFSSGRRKAFQF